MQAAVPIAPATLPRAWYSAGITAFLAAAPEAILGELAARADTFTTQAEQTAAWRESMAILREQLAGLEGAVYLEFAIPRLGRRIDAVVITGGVVLILEFKQAAAAGAAGRDQVWDYALDLKYFHAGSHAAPLAPILIAGGASAAAMRLEPDHDGIYRPITVAPGELREAINAAVSAAAAPPLDPEAWAAAPYLPTPGIVEAARALYARHTVQDIARYDAGRDNLTRTTARIEELLDAARRQSRKIIAFVTGVPGAGKTLAGLNLATRHQVQEALTHAVFLSGNHPLVAVLREALVRDELARRRRAGDRVRIGEIRAQVQPFIQNVHHYRDDGFRDAGPPADHVAIFDEAQRAWTASRLRNWLARRKREHSDASEPELLIGRLDRHADWALIVCLVGGGQEINTGEAGIAEWLRALQRKYPHWEAWLSPQLSESEGDAAEVLAAARQLRRLVWDEALHLAVSLRTFRAENYSRFVAALLEMDAAAARRELAALGGRYPLAVTRDLDRAKRWIHENARGSERYGLLASSKALRLKPEAVDVRVGVDPVRWFLDPPGDTRTSWYLEDAASEFDVQGLELDWACVTWDGDLRADGGAWGFREFDGKRWKNIHKADRRRYLKNAYRVLLTRARLGLVVFVPRGDGADATRSPALYDATFNYLVEAGVPVLA